MKISDAIKSANWLVDAADLTGVDAIAILIEFFPGVRFNDVIHCNNRITLFALADKIDPKAKAEDVTIRFWGGALKDRKWMSGTIKSYLLDKLYYHITMKDYEKCAFRTMEHLSYTLIKVG